MSPIISLREVPFKPPYTEIDTSELDKLRKDFCDLRTSNYYEAAARNAARAFWNEIARLRHENAAYVVRHREQEQSIVRARAERDTLKVRVDDLTGPVAQMYAAPQPHALDGYVEWSKLADAQEALRIMTEQRNEARAANESLQQRLNDVWLETKKRTENPTLRDQYMLACIAPCVSEAARMNRKKPNEKSLEQVAAEIALDCRTIAEALMKVRE